MMSNKKNLKEAQEKKIKVTKKNGKKPNFPIIPRIIDTINPKIRANKKNKNKTPENSIKVIKPLIEPKTNNETNIIHWKSNKNTRVHKEDEFTISKDTITNNITVKIKLT